MNVITCKGSFDRYFGHFTIVLVDFDLSTKIRNKVWVERQIAYESLPFLCSRFHSISHNLSSRKLNVKVNQEKVFRKETPKCTLIK